MLAAFAGSTRATCVFFSNFGAAYTCRVIDVPASTGYGEPIQRLFKLKDGEKIVAAMSLDPRAIGAVKPPPPRKGAAQMNRRSRRSTPSPSPATATRCASGSSRSSRPARARAGDSRGPAEGAEVVGVERVTGEEIMIAATAEARGLLCQVRRDQLPVGPRQGRHSHQAARTRTTACSGSSRRPATAIC